MSQCENPCKQSDIVAAVNVETKKKIFKKALKKLLDNGFLVRDDEGNYTTAGKVQNGQVKGKSTNITFIQNSDEILSQSSS